MSLNSNRVDAYLAFLGVERNLSPATIQSYQEDLRHFVDWLDETGLDLKALTPEKLDEFLTLTAGQVEYSPTSIARHFSSLRGFLKYMQSQGEYDYSTESMLERPKLGHYLPQYLTREEVDSVFESAANGKNPLRDTALFELMYSAGLRISETLGIKLSQLKSESLDRGRPPPHPPDYRQHNSKLPGKADDSHGRLEDSATAHRAPRQAGLAAYIQAQLCHALPGSGHGPARPTGTAGPRRHQYHANLYAYRQGIYKAGAPGVPSKGAGALTCAVFLFIFLV